MPAALAPDRLLAELMRTRLLAAGARPGHPVVLVAAGSHHAATQGDSVRVAQLLEQVWRGPVRAAHVAETVARRYRAAVAHRFALSLA